MPPHRELNPRFQAHFARARRIRIIGTGILVTCLLVGTGSAFAMLAPQENAAQSAIKNSFASIADTFGAVGSAFSRAANSITGSLSTPHTQTAAVSSDDSISNRIYRFFCPGFTDCEEPAIEFTTNTTPTTPVQPRPQPQQPITIATTSQNTSTQRPANIGTGAPTTVVNNPVIERVIERVVQGAPASLAGYVTQADLLSQIAAVKQSVGTQLYGDWYNNPGSSSNNGGILGTIGQMGRIDSLSGTELSDITVDGVSGLTDADIPDGITAANYLLLTGGAITGDLSLSGTLTAGSLAVSGVSSGGAIEAPYFTATSTSASSTFPNLNATNATTTNATSTNLFSTLGRFTTGIIDALSAVSATITNLTSTTLVATNATTTRLDAFDYVAVGRTATTTIRGDGVASTIPFASSTAISVSGVGFFGTASTTNFNLSGTANLQSLAADSLLYNNSSRQLAAASVGSSLSFTGSSLSLNLGNGNTWSALQQFSNASTSMFSAYGPTYFGATATSSFSSSGALTMGGNIILNGKYLSGDGGNEGIYVDTSGNVGIGTTSPSKLLDIYSTGSTDARVVSTTGQAFWKAENTGGSSFFGTERSGAGSNFIGSLSYATLIGNSTPTALQLGTDSIARMTIDPSGNVGIGTTTPNGKLAIVGPNNPGTGGEPTYVGALRIIESGGVTGGTGGLEFKSVAGGNGYGTRLSSPDLGNGETPFYIQTRSNSASWTDRLAILGSNGNVGIGTTTPGGKLHVASAFSGTTAHANANLGIFEASGSNGVSVLVPDASTSYYNLGSASANRGAWLSYNHSTLTAQIGAVSVSGQTQLIYNQGQVGLTLNASGNVGIGTASPGKKLDIAGDARIYTGANSGTLYFGSNGDGYFDYGSSLFTISKPLTVAGGITTNGSAGGLTIARQDTSAPAFFLYSAAGDLNIYDNVAATEKVTIKQGGNVGIGTTNPNDAKLEVKGGTVCVDTNSDDSATSCIASESDERLKTNIQAISASSSLDIINALNPVSFDWRATDPTVLAHWPSLGRYAGNEHSIGLIAQQVMPVLPEALSLETVGDSEVQYFQLDYTKFIPHLIGAVKELWAKVQDLGQKVAALFESVEEQNAKIQALEARVNALESQTGSAAASSGGGANTPASEPESEPIPESEAEEETVPDAEIPEATPSTEDSSFAEEIVSEASENTEVEGGGEAGAEPTEAPSEAVAGESETL